MENIDVMHLIEALPKDFTDYTGRTGMIAMIVAAVLAVAISLFGLKLIRLWNALFGLVLGWGVGAVVAIVAGLDFQGTLIAVIAGAVIVAVICALLKKFGAFLFCLLGVTGIMAGFLAQIMDTGRIIFAAICVSAALIIAVLAMIWFEPMIIIVTAFYGGTALANAVQMLVGLENIYITWAIGVAAALIGIAVQFMMKSKEIVKKQVKRAEEVKGEISKEAEVEQARMLLDEEEDEEE